MKATIDAVLCIVLSKPCLNNGDNPENIKPEHIKNGRNVNVSGTTFNKQGTIKNVDITQYNVNQYLLSPNK